MCDMPACCTIMLSFVTLLFNKNIVTSQKIYCATYHIAKYPLSPITYHMNKLNRGMRLLIPPLAGFIFCTHSSLRQAAGYSGQKIKNREYIIPCRFVLNPSPRRRYFHKRFFIRVCGHKINADLLRINII